MNPQSQTAAGYIAYSELESKDIEAIASVYADMLERGISIEPEVFAARFPKRDCQLLETLKSIRWIQLAARDLDAPLGIDPTSHVAAAVTDDPPPPALLGDYRLIREVGRGGMGIVYEAEQLSLARRVAVKMLPPSSWLSDRQIARFAMESQAAAQLQHPHIVPVYAVGCESGIYYYSMQFIEGHAPTGGMTPREVAHLGVSVADALQHSHELGIIHRDIKPSNLLLDIHGKVWVTDFGLARCHQADQMTASGAVLGTLRYMSPEQANGSITVDHRADIYSLGVTLYELLTGRCPFDASNRSAFLVELARGEPAGCRQIVPSIPADLETIVHKALCTDPQSRYPTARAMADDLKRFLNGEVIWARRPTALERLFKWVSRNRQWVAAAVAMWVVVSIAAIFATIALIKVERENRLALGLSQQSLKEADVFFSQAREVVDHFGISISRQLATIPGAEAARREVLHDTLRYYRNFMSQAERNSARQHDVALTYMKLGRIAEQLDALEEAREAYERSEFLWRSIDPNHSERGLCANMLGLLLTRQGKTAEAEVAFQIAIDCNRKIVAAEPANRQAQRRLALALTNRRLSGPLDSDTDNDAQDLHAAFELQQSLLANDQLQGMSKYELLVDVAKTLSGLAETYRWSVPAEARMHSQACIANLEEVAAGLHANLATSQLDRLTLQEARDELVVAYCNHAAILNDAGEVTSAITFAVKATELGSQLCHEISQPSRRVRWAAAQTLLARLQASQNNVSGQLDSFQQARNILADLVRDQDRVAEFRVDLAAACYNLHRAAKSLSSKSVASAAEAELLSQHRWLQVNAPQLVSHVAELVNQLNLQSGNL